MSNQIEVIDQLMKTVVARLLWLRECAEGNDELLAQIDAAIEESSTVSQTHEIEVARLVTLVDEVRQQRDEKIGLLKQEYAFREDMERDLDNLLTSIDDLRKQAEHPEKILARRVLYQMDFTQEDAETALDIMTGNLDVYLSTYTMGDLREALEIAIQEIKETRLQMEEEGGVAE